MTRKLQIEQLTITDESDCFVIAEIGNNHQGELQKAMEMFKAAKECGVDAVKLQKRDNKSLLTKAAYENPMTMRIALARHMANTVRHWSSVKKNMLN